MDFGPVDLRWRLLVVWQLAESFFATLECELLDQYRFARHTDARYEIMSFIEWYNRRRRHTSLDNISPVRYEENHQLSAHAA